MRFKNSTQILAMKVDERLVGVHVPFMVSRIRNCLEQVDDWIMDCSPQEPGDTVQSWSNTEIKQDNQRYANLREMAYGRPVALAMAMLRCSDITVLESHSSRRVTSTRGRYPNMATTED
jgi:hypothetical protein